MINKEWVRVATLQGELQAELIRGLLEAQGVATQLSQEGLGRVYGMGVGPLAEVDILVPAEMKAIATEILDRYTAGDFDTDDGMDT